MFILTREYLTSFKVSLSHLLRSTEDLLLLFVLEEVTEELRKAHRAFPEGFLLFQSLGLEFYKLLPIFTPKSLIN